MDILKSKDIIPQVLDRCHNGEGTLLSKSVLDGLESEKFGLMHSDEIPAGVSIGEHLHMYEEEIYYLLSGKGILTFDGKQYEMKSGDISLCKPGHSHGFAAIDDSRMIVVGSK